MAQDDHLCVAVTKIFLFFTKKGVKKIIYDAFSRIKTKNAMCISEYQKYERSNGHNLVAIV